MARSGSSGACLLALPPDVLFALLFSFSGEVGFFLSPSAKDLTVV